jgi:lysophospholipase L1-like esterase
VTSAGTAVRAEFSALANPHGFTILAASIARPAAPTSLTVSPGSSLPLTFAGRPGIDVPPGARVLSDPIPFATTDNSPVLVTVSAGAGDAFVKGIAVEPGGCSTGAAVPSAATAPASAFDPRLGSVRWLRSLLVEGSPQRSVAALGDSITEGPGPVRPGDYLRWTDVLAAAGTDVVNAGVTGNLLTGVGGFGSASGEDRSQALLAEPNLTDLVLCMGTNDLAFGRTSDQLLASAARIIASARGSGIRVWMCTIGPRAQVSWDAAQERERRAFNVAARGLWLSSRGGSVVDMDATLRSPTGSSRMRAAFDSGDHVHPNAAGARAMGLTALSALGLPSTVTPSSAPAGNDARA